MTGERSKKLAESAGKAVTLYMRDQPPITGLLAEVNDDGGYLTMIVRICTNIDRGLYALGPMYVGLEEVSAHMPRNDVDSNLYKDTSGVTPLRRKKISAGRA